MSASERVYIHSVEYVRADLHAGAVQLVLDARVAIAELNAASEELRTQLAAKERECERLRQGIVNILDGSDMLVMLRSLRALAEGEPDKLCTSVEKHASYVLGRIVATIRDNKGNHPEAVLHLVVIVLNNAGINVFTHDALAEGGGE